MRVRDSRGNSFNSIEEMIAIYGVEKEEVAKIVRRCNVSTVAAIELAAKGIKTNTARTVKDHLGNRFETKQDMCQAYGVTAGRLNYYINKYNVSVAEALQLLLAKEKSTPKKEEIIERRAEIEKQHEEDRKLKVEQKRKEEASGERQKAARKPRTVIKRVVTPEIAKELSKGSEELAEISEYNKRLDAYKVVKNYRNRVVVDGVEIPNVNLMDRNGKVRDHLGNRYISFELMARAYKQKPRTVQSRLEMGWTLERALYTRPWEERVRALREQQRA